jgi:hypothetical protein
MKVNTSILGLMCILVSGCSGFLDLAPIDATNVQNFYRNASDMQAAVTAA